MLRVGLTGELGAGKTTVLRMLAAHGAHVFSSDEMGRAMMQPGEPVYAAIVDRFGSGVVRADGQLDRGALARMAFDPESPRVEELNAIVHPAVLAEQTRLLDELAAREPHAIAVVESALLFSTRHAGDRGWRERFDAVVVVTAPESEKLRRFVERSGAATPEAQELARADALRRLAAQTVPEADGVLRIANSGTLAELTARVDALWAQLFQLEAGLNE